MAELIVLWLCVLGFAGLVLWVVRLRMQAAEWDSIAEHHELMAALDPEVRRG